MPLIGGVSLFILPFDRVFGKQKAVKMVRLTGLLISLITFFLSIFIWVLFDNTTTKFQFLETFSWSPMSNFYVSFGVDGISLFFVLLTTLFTPIALLCSWEFPKKGPSFLNKGYVSAFLIMETFILIVFTSLDLLVF